MKSIAMLSFLLFSTSLWCQDRSIMLQGFKWDSAKVGNWWNVLASKSKEISSAGFNIVWFPPSQDSLSDEGYLPRQLYVQNSKYGSAQQLKNAISALHSNGVYVLADVVANHRVGVKDWADFSNPDWGLDACAGDDEYNGCKGSRDSGKKYEAARDIDHSKSYVREDIKRWLLMLKEIGYDGWRYDYARGFSTSYLREYDDFSSPIFSVAEIWDDLDINNPDSHRQALCDWMDAAGKKIKVFDFTTKGLLQRAISYGEYWRLKDRNGQPSGLIGWWPGNSVTFIENHDTQERQGSGNKAWPFPYSKIAEGYAYILTHPGIPCVFWPHYFESNARAAIDAMIKIRIKNGINSRSSVSILAASDNIYAALIDGKVAVKLGSKLWDPGNGWVKKIEGQNYTIWTKK